MKEQAIEVVPCATCGGELKSYTYIGWGCPKCNCDRCPCHGIAQVLCPDRKSKPEANAKADSLRAAQGPQAFSEIRALEQIQQSDRLIVPQSEGRVINLPRAAHSKQREPEPTRKCLHGIHLAANCDLCYRHFYRGSNNNGRALAASPSSVRVRCIYCNDTGKFFAWSAAKGNHEEICDCTKAAAAEYESALANRDKQAKEPFDNRNGVPAAAQPESQGGVWLSDEDWDVMVQIGGYLSGLATDSPKRKHLLEFRDWIIGVTIRRQQNRAAHTGDAK